MMRVNNKTGFTKMKKYITLLSALALFSSQAIAATVSIGPYELETDAAATAASFTGSVFENVADAITDNEVNTYIRGDSEDAAVSLGFNNIALSNQDGNDLALFFLTADNDISIDLNSVSQSYTSSQLFVNPVDPFVDTGEMYLVQNIFLPTDTAATGPTGSAELSVIFIDLDVFGIGIDQSIADLSIALGDSLMTYAVGLNPALGIAPVIVPQPVPLPASVFLFLSGIAGFGLIGRRKK